MPGKRYGTKIRSGYARKPSLRGPKRGKPSEDLIGAVDEIVRMARPELDEGQRERAAVVIAEDVRPQARRVSIVDVHRVQARVEQAVQDTRAAALRHSRLTH